MTDQPKDDDKVTACPRCSGEMVVCTLDGYPGRPSLRPLHHEGIFDSRSSLLNAIACTACGYTELYATTPRKLVPKQQTKLENLLHGQPGEELT